MYKRNTRMKASPEKFCPTCNLNKMYKWEGVTHECDCQLQLALYKHYLVAGIGVRYQRLDWFDFDADPEALRVAQRYLDNPGLVDRGIGLLFHGSIGTGKTMVATLVLKDLVKRGYTCYATTFAEMIEMYTAGWYDEADKKKFSAKMMYSDVLLLDDIGKEYRRKNKLEETTFDSVLRTRVQGGRATFVTTNMTMKEMKEGYGAGIFSLISEVSIDHTFTGIDYRVKSSHREVEEILAGEVRPIF